jgi:hypothetical protein
MNASMTGSGMSAETPRGLMGKIGRAAGLYADRKIFGAEERPETVVKVQNKLTDRVIRPGGKEDLGLMRNLLSALKNNALQKIENCKEASN